MKSIKWKILIVAILVSLLFLSCGCVEQPTETVSGETGYIEFLVTDKNIEKFDHVNITFSEIKISKKLSDDNTSWVTITATPKTVDLLYLNLNHINETLGTAEIETGNYSKLWIHVTHATGVLNSTGENVDIDVPSGWLKIQQLHLFNVTKGNNTLLIDIDLENSIHTYHKGEKYKFIPVINRIEFKHEKKIQFKEHEHNKIKNMIENRAPEIDIIVNNTPLSKNKNIYITAMENITFNASGSFDPDGDNLTYSWDFDDNTTATGAVVVHSFNDSKKPYQVVLTVTDNVTTVSETINVHIK